MDLLCSGIILLVVMYYDLHVHVVSVIRFYICIIILQTQTQTDKVDSDPEDDVAPHAVPQTDVQETCQRGEHTTNFTVP